MSSEAPSTPPPAYGDIRGGTPDDKPDPAADEGPTERKKQNKSLMRRVFGFFLGGRGPPKSDLKIVVHEKSPKILEINKYGCCERTRRVAVEVQVSASVTARSRRCDEGGWPVVSATATWLSKRSAQAPFTKGDAHSVARATQKATREAAEDAHQRAAALASVAATARALEKVAALGRVV